jgi:hypothetical protein
VKPQDVIASLIYMTPFAPCSFCRYCDEGGSPCESDPICTHPLPVVREQDTCGDLCWAFRPLFKADMMADIVGVILVNGDNPYYWCGDKGKVEIRYSKLTKQEATHE